MSKLGLSGRERAELSRAKRESDQLVTLERVAMSAAKGLHKDKDGRLTVEGKPNLSMARKLLHGQEYYDAKARIMKPIERFFALLKWRTAHEASEVRNRSGAIVLAITILAVMAMLLAPIVLLVLRRRVISPLALLEAGACAIGSGDLAHVVEVRSEDEVGNLARAFNAMVGTIRERSAELRAAAKRLELATVSAGVGVWDWDIKGGGFAWDKTMCALYDVSPEDFGNNYEAWKERVHPEDFQRAEQDLEEAVQNSQRFDSKFRVTWLDGSIRHLRAVGALHQDEDGKAERMVGVNWDVTAQELSACALRESKAKLEHALQAADAGTFVHEVGSAKLEFDSRAQQILELPAAECSVESWRGALHPDDLAPTRAIFAEAIKAQRERVEVDYRVLQPGKKPRHVLEQSKNRYSETGALVKAYGVVFDVTARKLAEKVQTEHQRHAVLEAEVGKVLRESFELATALQRCAEAMVEHFDAAFARIWTLNHDEQVLELQVSAGLYTHVDGDHARVPVGALKIGLIASERKPHLTNQVIGDPRVGNQQWARREKMVAFAGYPLIVDGRVEGVLALFARQLLSEETLHTLRRVSGVLALGISRQRAERAVQESEVKFRSLFEATEDAVMLLSGERFIDCNPATLEMFGYDAVAEFATMHPADLSPALQPDGRSSLEAANERIAVAFEKGSNRFDWVHMRQDGTTFAAEVLLNVMQLRGQPVLEAVVRDITERRRAVEEIREARDAAEAANLAKSAFLANMSHEIRTPMNAILGYAQLLQRDSTLGQKQREQIAIVHRSGDHLLTLLNDILEMSKIEAGRIALCVEPCDLHSLLQDVALMFQERASDKGLQLELHIDGGLPRMVELDSGRLRQIVINLLSNAVKFTGKGGRVRICANSGALRADRHAFTIAVDDNGCGIEPDYLDKVFTAFEQTPDGSRQGGTGLGLAISRSFARLMEGELTVDSTLGVGSCFTLEFEAAVGASTDLDNESPLEIPVGLAPSESRNKVLVVDDVETNRALLSEMLSAVGFEVCQAADGEAAIRESHARRPDLILMDMRMPGLDGLEVTRRLRASANSGAIVVVSASVYPDDRKNAIAAGADDFLAKPFSEAKLFAVIKDVLGIEYEYGSSKVFSTAPSQPEEDLLVQALFGLPAELIDELREATLKAQMDRISAIIDQVAESAPDLAKALRRLADRFQYETLLYLLDS